jgi:biotin transporter BioY
MKAWLYARFSERSTQAALAQLLTIWNGIATAVVSGAGTTPMNLMVAAAMGATVPCVISIFLPEAVVPAAAVSAVAAPQPAPVA